MTTDLLTLTQWLSPAFPLGSFAYSHGIETEIAEGRITSADDLQDWLEIVIRRGTGQSDAVLLMRAMAGEDMLAYARAMAASKERSEETEAQGAAFAKTLGALGTAQHAGPLPVVVGEAARQLDLEPTTVAALYLHAFASNLVSCAVRFVPLGQEDGQRVLTRLKPAIAETVEAAKGVSVCDLRNAAFLSDCAAMAHEGLVARMFRT
ncbi:urease accessory protein UreF [Shimia ponticola]|uniref:urease accessory protein UreF n=1 Tax=Shimia ponticola TaxID=2582893 RepID=UPI0011BE1BD7|nr:urease accessory UreF family protein [Shimia ponticola]